MQADGRLAGKVRVGIIGLGRSGWKLHAVVLSAHPGYHVSAVADPVAERRAEASQRLDCAVYAEPAGVLLAADVDVIVIATPSHTHHELTLAALRAGKHVVVEKPMARDLDEFDEMVAAAEKEDRILTCFQQRRLDPMLTITQDLLASGRLGRLVSVRRTHTRFMRRTDWQTLRRFGGGELAVHGAHLIDQMLVLLGDGPVEVFADLQHTVGAGDAEDHVKLCLRGSNGVVADIEHSLCAAFPRREWEVMGTMGGVMSRDENRLAVRWLDPAALASLTADEGPAADRRYHNLEALPWREEVLAVHQDDELMARQFYDRLYATFTASAPLLVTPASVRRQIEIIEAARRQLTSPDGQVPRPQITGSRQ